MRDARERDDVGDDGIDVSAMVQEARRRAAALAAQFSDAQRPGALNAAESGAPSENAAVWRVADATAMGTVSVPPPPPVGSSAASVWRAQPRWKDASEIRLDDVDDVRATTTTTTTTTSGNVRTTYASRDADNRRARENLSVGCIPDLVRRANCGVLGVYAPIEPGTATEPDIRPRAYIDARFARFERDLSGYDAGTSARNIMQNHVLPRTSAPSRVATLAAPTPVEPRRADDADVARPGLGSRITDESRAGDEYAQFRASRSYRSRTR